MLEGNYHETVILIPDIPVFVIALNALPLIFLHLPIQFPSFSFLQKQKTFINKTSIIKNDLEFFMMYNFM